MAMLSAFNPHDMSERTVRTVATGRDDALREILAAVRSNLRAPTMQHLIVSAPRGYGKSFLMRHLQFEVTRVARDEGLPLAVVLMPEEMPHVKEPETLVRELTRALTGGAASEAELTWHEDDGEAWDGAVERLQEAIRDKVRPDGVVVALVENFDVLLRRAFPKDVQASRLRALLSDQACRLMVVAASATGAFDRNYDDRLFHAFTEVALEPWSIDDCMAFFDRQRVEAGDAPLDDAARARGRAVASFIGGTPRLATLLGDALFDDDVLRAADLLQRLVDELTPYYKERIEALPGRSQKLLDALLRGGEPATPSEVARRVQAKSQAAIAGPFSDLARERIIVGERALGSAEMLYRVADRVFAHYYRRRVLDHGAPTCPLEALVDLLAQFFTPEEKRGKVAEFVRLGRMPEARLMARLIRVEHGTKSERRNFLYDLAAQHIPYWLAPLASNAIINDLQAIADAALHGDIDRASAIVDQGIIVANRSDSIVLLLVRPALDYCEEIDAGLAAAQDVLALSKEVENPILRLEALLIWAWHLNSADHHAAAIAQAVEAEVEAERLGRKDYQSRAARCILLSLSLLGRNEEVIATAQRAADLAREVGDGRAETECLRQATISLGDLGRHEEAVITGQHAADLAHVVGDRRAEAECLRHTAFSLGRLSRYDQAVMAVRHAADLAHAEGDRQEEVECLRLAAFGLGELGRHVDAITTATEAANLARAADNLLGEGMCLCQAAFSNGQLGRHEEAITMARHAADLAHAAADTREEAECLRHAAFSLACLKRHEEAVTTARQAADLARAVGDTAEVSECLRHVAFSLGQLGSHDEAIIIARQAADLARLVGSSEEAVCLRHATFSLGELGRHEEAIATGRQATSSAKATGDRGEEAECLRLIALSLADLERHEEAVFVAREAATLAGSARDSWTEKHSLLLLALELTNIGRSEEALLPLSDFSRIIQSNSSEDDRETLDRCIRYVACSAVESASAASSYDSFHNLLTAAAEAFSADDLRRVCLTTFLKSLMESALSSVEVGETLHSWAIAVNIHFPGRFTTETAQLQSAAKYHASGRSRAVLARLDPDLARTLETLFPAAETPTKGRKAGGRRKR